MAVRFPSVAAIRRASGHGLPDGTIRLLFVRDGGRVGLIQTPQETANDADQFTALYLERMITDVAAPGAVVVIHRSDGRPTYVDRQLWTMLSTRLEPTTTKLLDLIVVGTSQLWSARRRGLLSPRRRPPARRSASRASAR